MDASTPASSSLYGKANLSHDGLQKPAHVAGDASRLLLLFPLLLFLLHAASGLMDSLATTATSWRT